MVVKWLLFIFFVILPFQWALFSTAQIDVPLARVLSGVIIVCWLALRLSQRRVSLPTPVILFFFSATLFWSTLSLFWSAHPSLALGKIIFLWNFLPLFIVLADVLLDKNFRDFLLKGAIGGAVAAAVVGILQFVLQFVFSVQAVYLFHIKIITFFLGKNFGQVVAEYPSLLVNVGGQTLVRAAGFFPDPHMFSYYLLILIPFAFLYSQNTKSIFWKLAPFVLLVGVGVSFSRSAYVALLLVAPLVVLWRMPFKRLVNLKTITVIILGAGIFFGSPIFSRTVSTFSPVDGSIQERLRLWSEAIQVIGAHPVLGVGIGNYATFVNPVAKERDPIYVHNTYLDIAVELGIVGLILFLGLIGSAIARLVTRGPVDGSGSTALISLALFSTQSFFENPLFSVQVLPVLLLVLSFAYVTSKKQ